VEILWTRRQKREENGDSIGGEQAVKDTEFIPYLFFTLKNAHSNRFIGEIGND
jgi:hypothetical protein